MNRAIRNNNPLNIRRSADRWQGARMEQTDKAFVQFISMPYGYRAAWKVMETYWQIFNYLPKNFSVRNIITRWAPPTENDTEAYIRSVREMTGLKPDDHFSRPSTGIDYKRLALLMRAMTTMECGIPYSKVDMVAISMGFDMAFSRSRYVRKKKCGNPEPVDVNISILPEMKGAAYTYWDEYSDW
jgi:hypothetical protein